MEGQTITVAEIVSPQPGKKQYKVIDISGQQYGVWADHIGDYTINGTYRLNKVKSNVFKGTTYYTIEESEFIGMDGEAGASMGAPSRPTARRPYTAPVRTAARPPLTPTGEQQRRMDIFVCGAFNNIMANPTNDAANMPTSEYIRIISNLRAAWRNTMATEQRSDDMNDELPI